MNPYAKAIFEIALADETISEWSALLRSAVMVAGDHQVRVLFNNPRVSGQQLADFFIGILFDSLSFDSLGFDSINAKAKSFIKLLAEYHRLNLMPSIAFAFEQLVSERKNVLNAQVTSVYPLNEKSESDLMAALRKRFGCDVNLTYNTDKNLIGGIVIRVGDLVIDSSIRDKLIRLKESLIAQ